MKTYIIIILSILLTITSCQKIIDVSIPENERKIVLYSILNTDSLFTADVLLSNHIQERDIQNKNVTNAIVEVYEDNILIDTLKYKEQARYVSANKKPTTGHQYTIKVKVPGKTETIGTTNLPPIPQNILLDTSGYRVEYYNYYDEYQEYKDSTVYLKYKLTLNDNKDEQNYYRLRVFGTFINYIYELDPNTNELIIVDSTLYNEYFYINYDHPAIEFSNNQFVYFSDKLFNGDKLSFDFEISNYGIQNFVQIVAFVESITPEYFSYKQTQDLAYNNDFMFFMSQPTIVYNNIKNGLGMVGATSSVNKTLINPYYINKLKKQ